jgi:hypothetical protein
MPSTGRCERPLDGGELPAEHISNNVVDGAILTPGELPLRVQGVVGGPNPLIDLPHSGPV